jgi:circadian clock protein KaiC
MTAKKILEIEKTKTGIEGFDSISKGGLPLGRPTLVAGTSGSGKTVLAAQFLAAGIEKDEGGVFITFEETPEDIKKNVLSLGWDVDKFEKAGKWAFVDASPQMGVETMEIGSYDLGALLARVEHAVNKVNARRVVVDSIGSIFSRFTDSGRVRNELFRLAAALKVLKVTALITAERTEEFGEIARFGIEEFVADNVIIMRNVLEAECRRRTIEILKFRGTSHQKGEFPFTIVPGVGIVVLPLTGMELKHRSSNERISSGIIELDKMCGGGFFQDSVLLISGATGCGKTMMSAEFVNAGAKANERSIIFAFEESKSQLARNASGWGIDFEQMEKDGIVKMLCEYPEVNSLEDHLVIIKKAIEEFKPNRVVVDSLSALERVSTLKGFREFVIALTSLLKQKEVAGLLTSTTVSLLGGTSVTEAHISTITDTIILLRYVEVFGEMRRGITVLKMRGSMHDKTIREFTIGPEGMRLKETFSNVSGILSGTPVHRTPDEAKRIDDLFVE